MSVLFFGNVSSSIKDGICKHLKTEIERTQTYVSKFINEKFSDGETRIEIQQNVRGQRAFIVSSISPPCNDSLMETALLADALKRSSAKRVIAVIPYLGYSRQDRRPGYSRVPISARVVADILQYSGIDHLITVDLHATQIQGFYKIPVDNISATHLFVASIYKNWISENPIIISPDVGGVARARSVAKHLDNIDLAIVDKRRPNANVSEVMNIIGDVENKTCIIIDDMVDTAGTLGKAADALIEKGAKQVVAYATHGVLSGKANENILNSKLKMLFITDSVKLPDSMKNNPKIEQISISGLLAETITRIDHKQSISLILD
jgi:ribose-phosphate pyrophosphokinase